MLKMACLFSMILSAQAVRFDGKAELASLSAHISKLKMKNPAAAAGGRIENTTSTGSILTETGESTGAASTYGTEVQLAQIDKMIKNLKNNQNATSWTALNEVAQSTNVQSGNMLKSIRDLLEEIETFINGEKSTASGTHLDMCTDEVGEANEVGEEVDSIDSQLTNLVGCKENSQCEKDTNELQQKATLARNIINQKTSEINIWEPQLTQLRTDKETEQTKKSGLETSKTTNQGAHGLRLQKFDKAISVLTRIRDSLNGNTGDISMPESELVTEDEKKILGDFKVASAMLLVVSNSKQSALADPTLVSTLKELLTSCITSLTTSRDNEVDEHNKWIDIQDTSIEVSATQITSIAGDITTLETNILNANTEINTQTPIRDDAIGDSNTLRGECIADNTAFMTEMTTFENELAAIDEMYSILESAGLADTTVAIRDETDDTKHGVHESLNANSANSGTPNYRLTITKTFGADHACLTEIEFKNAQGDILDATFVSGTSCLGCDTCNGCTSNYGNAAAALDGVSNSDAASAWWCTSTSFSGSGAGSESIYFTLPEQPSSYALVRTRINGDWVAQHWNLDQKLSDGSWKSISIVTDSVKAVRQEAIIANSE